MTIPTDEQSDQLASIGKGLVQLNLKLSRVIEALESMTQASSRAGNEAASGDVAGSGPLDATEDESAATISIIFDLIDAIDAAIEHAPDLAGSAGVGSTMGVMTGVAAGVAARVAAGVAAGAGAGVAAGVAAGAAAGAAASAAVAPAARQPRWWWRLFRRSPSLTESTTRELARGIFLAREQSLERLRQLGITAAPIVGVQDPAVHQAIDRVPTAELHRVGRIQRTHRRGWIQIRGDQRRVLRHALVTVYTAGGSQS